MFTLDKAAARYALNCEPLSPFYFFPFPNRLTKGIFRERKRERGGRDCVASTRSPNRSVKCFAYFEPRVRKEIAPHRIDQERNPRFGENLIDEDNESL